MQYTGIDLSICTQCKKKLGKMRIFLNIETLAEMKNNSGQYESLPNSLNSVNECLCEECFNDLLDTLKIFFDKKNMAKSEPKDIMD